MNSAIQTISLAGCLLVICLLAWDAYQEHRKATRARRFRQDNPRYFFRG